jgi:hypothetical protein
METVESIFNKNDFVYLKNGESVESSGYKINSLLMNEEIPAMNTMNNESQVAGGSVSSILNNLAVPAGLLLMQQKTLKHYKDENGMNDQVVNDDLFDKLLKMAGPNKNKKLTKKHKFKGSNKRSNRKTKRR